MYCEVIAVRRRTPSIGESDVADSLIEHYIEDAQRIIDGALYKMYSVPFDPIPGIIVLLAADISSYLMMRDYPDKVFDDDLKRIEETYQETLKAIIDGETALIGATPTSTSSAGVYVYKIVSSGERWDDQP
jgi:phage gp36-like protein